MQASDWFEPVVKMLPAPAREFRSFPAGVPAD
jgi:hypothetical protein